jgi:hypothetical protein
MDRDWTASFSIRFRNDTCIIILDKKYNIANSSCHFGSYGPQCHELFAIEYTMTNSYHIEIDYTMTNSYHIEIDYTMTNSYHIEIDYTMTNSYHIETNYTMTNSYHIEIDYTMTNSYHMEVYTLCRFRSQLKKKIFTINDYICTRHDMITNYLHVCDVC